MSQKSKIGMAECFKSIEIFVLGNKLVIDFNTAM